MPYPESVVGFVPAVILPYLSVVTLLYVPAVTPDFVKYKVPVVVIFPPSVLESGPDVLRPAPALT